MASIKRNLVYNFLLSFSQLLLPVLSIPYIARVLDPEGIGRVSFIDSFTFYFVIIAEFGITTYGIREVARNQHDPARLQILVPQLLTLHVISSLVTAVFYGLGLYLLFDRIGDIRLVWFSISFFLVNFFASEWYFMGMERFGYIALRSVLVRILGLISILVLVQERSDYYLYYAIIAGSAILTGIWNMILLFRDIPFRFRKIAWRPHLRFVWVTYLISLFYSIPLMLDNVLLGLASTTAMVGIYSFSVKVVRIGSTLLTDSFLVFFPRIVSLSAGAQFQQLREKLSLNLQFITLLAIPMGMGLLLVATDLTQVFFGDKFADAAINLRILALFPLIKGVSLFLSNPVLIALQHERAVLRNMMVCGVLYIVLVLFTGHHHGAAGACVALVLSEFVLLILNYISVRRLLPELRPDVAVLFQPALASLSFIPFVFGLHWLISDNLVRLILSVGGCLLLYGLALMLMKNQFLRLMLRSLKQAISPAPFS